MKTVKVIETKKTLVTELEPGDVLLTEYGENAILKSKVNSDKTISLTLQMKYGKLVFNYGADKLLDKII